MECDFICVLLHKSWLTTCVPQAKCVVLCFAGLPAVSAQAVGAPPTITLFGDPIITVMSGELSAYTLCTPNDPQDLICDPGVQSATDHLGGDLLAAGKVTACSESSTLAKAGLAACSMVIQLDVPGEYTVKFGVRDSQVCAPVLCLLAVLYDASVRC
jgi:hypothetical protein